MSGHIVGFGELLIRLSPPEFRLIVQAQNLLVEVGGAEANVLAGLASLGHATAMIGRVADNPLGRLAVATLRARGIDTAHVTPAPGRMGLYFLEVGQGLRASTITYDRSNSVFARSEPDDFDFDAALHGARLLHLSGITPALGEAGARMAIAAATAARRAGVAISFDGNYRAQLWESWDSDPRAILTEIVALSDIMFGDHRDIALLTGRTFTGGSDDKRRDAVEAAFDAFPDLALIASTARRVVRADEHGLIARVDTRTDRAQTEELTISAIVDRVGTGDAFAAGVLHAWLRNEDCTTMAHTGLSLAALKHSLPGDMPIFDEAQLLAFTTGGFDVRR